MLPLLAKTYTRLLVPLTYLYAAGVLGWALLHGLYDDRWWWLFFLNTFAFYFFLPLPLLVLLALSIRRRGVWLNTGLVLTVGLYFYGGMFWPKWPPASTPGPTLTVMTYNLLGFNEQTDAVLAAIRAADADVVAFQELSPLMGDTIRRHLMTEYPYQSLNPQPGVVGLGLISRYPLQLADDTLPGDYWCGRPQLATLTFGDIPVTLINFHTIPPGSPANGAEQEWSIREREQQARTLVEFTQRQAGPVIALGDLNATDMSTAYELLVAELRDAWRLGGWGLGHTFPGADSPGSSRPHIAGFPVPQWLIRLDYVFHSEDWQTVKVWLGPEDGGSDHRPVVAQLSILNPNLVRNE